MADKIATREAYGKALVDLGNENGKVVVLDADLAGATMTKYFKAAHPDRFFDMGIAEADMVATSAGLSTMGLIPYCSTFAMFGAGRAYDQMRNSVAYPHFNVKLCCSHAGVSVGEDGGSLSQGQKQLLCITRVMLCLPPMLILDEATSSIDTRTEIKIQKAFLTMMQGRTSFIVAHRLSTIREADIILVMKDGKIIEQGNHESLLAADGFYANLYNSQFA